MISLLKPSYLVFLPLFAALVILLPIFGNNEVRIRRFAKGFALFHFLYSLFFVASYNLSGGYQYLQEIKFFSRSLIEPLGIGVKFGLDGLSLAMVLLTSFMVLMALVASKSAITRKQKYYYPLVLILECALLGVFCAKDMFLFLLFWEIELIATVFLIWVWGNSKAKPAAIKYLIWLFVSSIFLMLAIALMMAFSYKFLGIQSADIEVYIVQAGNFPFVLQIAAFISFALAFLIALPVVPFNSWLVDAHTNAPTPLSMLLAGVILKTGAYGIIRFNFQILGEVFSYFSLILITLGVINIVYASFCALYQKDLKRLIAYSSIASMGVILIGISSMNAFSLIGAILLMAAHGLIIGALFMSVGTIYLRTKTRNLRLLGGLGPNMKKSMFLTLLFVLAGLGLPLLAAFVPEFMIFFGAYNTSLDSAFLIKILIIVALTSMVFSAGYLLKMFHGVYAGSPIRDFKNICDLSPHELTVLISFAIAILVLGIYPQGVIAYLKPLAGMIYSFI